MTCAAQRPEHVFPAQCPARVSLFRILLSPRSGTDQASLAQPRLHGIAAALDAEIERAEHEAIAAPVLLYRLLSQKAAPSQERSLAYYLKQAHLPLALVARYRHVDRQRGFSRAQIQTLAELDFVRRADNLLFIGKPGTGKTGLAMAHGNRVKEYVTRTKVQNLYQFSIRWAGNGDGRRVNGLHNIR